MISRKGTTCRTAAVLIFAVGLFSTAHSQTETAMIRGFVTDPTNARIVDAKVAAITTGTNAVYETRTNAAGEYSLPNLPPGRYRIEVEKNGFRKLVKPDVVVHVQDTLAIDFEMQVGSASESINVTAGAPLLNTSDARVSTLIDNRFVENMPLNGRSFSSLLDLTPGVVLVPVNTFEQGQFSVNGQRPDANYFTVDGVSANLGVVGNGTFILGQGGAGQLPTTSSFGGMSNLVSIDALQEFRVQTSTFAPEYGRTPGAQVSVVTKSGTNTFHGTAFEYFRNDVLDANDWFANHKGLKKAALRQNDFGGVLGGPIIRNKLFFFGSYEGLRVRQPRVADTYVPTLASRQTADAAVQPLLNAFPKPNGADLGNGTAGFSATYSDPSSLDSGSIRVDYSLSKSMTLFARYSDAPSDLSLRGAPGTANLNYNSIDHTEYRTKTLTGGLNQGLGSHSSNEFRFNYSRSRAHDYLTLDDFGGGVPPAISVLYPSQPSFSPDNSEFLFFGDFNKFGLLFAEGKSSNNREQQINFTDNFSHVLGAHQLKFGIDYRSLKADVEPVTYQIQYIFGSAANTFANKLTQSFIRSQVANVQLAFSNWSLFAQDTWNLSPKLTLTYGLRWDYNAAPSSPNGTLPFTVDQVDNLKIMQLAPQGTTLWQAAKDNFAPRLGVAWKPFANLVLRAGAGIFYDLGYGAVSDGISRWPYVQTKILTATASAPLKFPLDANNAAPLAFTTSPPVNFIAVVDPKHVSPRTYEWNAAVERGFGTSDVVTLTYVGAGGRKLMRRDLTFAPNSTFNNVFEVQRNAATSSYNGLQAQYRHRLSHGVQTLVSYTWSHSIDDVSSDGAFVNVPLGASPSERGPSNYDIRHTFSAAVSYDVPGPGSGVLKRIFGSWSTDSIIYVRSDPPVNVVTGALFPGTLLAGSSSVQRPNVVPGVPFYLYGGQYPGGKIINPAAFTTPVPATAQGNLGRNALRGFSAAQWDITLRRQFRFTEKLGLQFRSDFFNILNHPNFGSPINYMISPQFGQSTQMLNNYLGSGGQSGGLNPLYQIGGPRSIQLALKLQF